MSNAGGTEFLFWIFFFALILGALALSWFYEVVMRMQAAERENIKLRIEVKRCRLWLRIKPENWSWDDPLRQFYENPLF